MMAISEHEQQRLWLHYIYAHSKYPIQVQGTLISYHQIQHSILHCIYFLTSVDHCQTSLPRTKVARRLAKSAFPKMFIFKIFLVLSTLAVATTSLYPSNSVPSGILQLSHNDFMAISNGGITTESIGDRIGAEQEVKPTGGLTQDTCRRQSECISPRGCFHLDSNTGHFSLCVKNGCRCFPLYGGLTYCSSTTDCVEGEVCTTYAGDNPIKPFCMSEKVVNRNPLLVKV